MWTAGTSSSWPNRRTRSSSCPRGPTSRRISCGPLLRWRERAGLTQQELAGICGLARYQISWWETGDARPEPGSLKLLVRGLAEAMGAPFAVADLLDPADHQSLGAARSSCMNSTSQR
ncbi:helix-turn-helix domain-containing protein [Actinosynnema sp. ALI-1.44]|uniref:helix-turn-helix domain-containing protein n=1 Tax=Actinosynnema sp. ALI-1.44 TaxID=1933779 RepID=UPI000A01ADB5